MKIISWNVNGFRSVYQKGFLKWFADVDADIVCLQEIKAAEDQLPPELLYVPEYHAYFHSAKKKGYAGVAVYTKVKPLRVETEFGMERFDSEGRMLRLT